MGEPLTEAASSPPMSRPGTRAGDAEALDAAPALRRLGDADRRRAGAAIAGGTLFHVPRKVDPQHLVPVETIERDGVHHAAPAASTTGGTRRLRADRPRHDRPAGARPGQLLHLVPQPGQGFLLARA